jgi:guanine deaminase
METNSFVLKGDVCYNISKDLFDIRHLGYVVCVNGHSAGVYDNGSLPEQYTALPLIDCGHQLIVPGLNDIHVHAPQYGFRGIAMDLELLDWLNTYTFPEEKRYAELAYAENGYSIFAEDLQHSFTTRAVIFATMHVPATELLMDKLEATGLKTYVGKVNMDRNSPDYLTDGSAEQSLSATRKWLSEVESKHYVNTFPILTPRFTPTCSDELMKGLGEIKAELGLPVQSHLSENLSEIDWVKGLCPWSTCYGQTYEHFGLLGSARTIMAHCNYSTNEEIEILKKTDTYVAHCPQSNAFLSSGIAPIRRYLQEGMNVGLGTDVAGGASINMFRAVADAVACSKLRWRCVDQNLAPLTIQEAFYLATIGGGSFFGRVGSFAKGFDFDALVLDDSGIRSPRELNIAQRLERFCYLADEGGKLTAKYVAGRQIQL